MTHTMYVVSACAHLCILMMHRSITRSSDLQQLHVAVLLTSSAGARCNRNAK